MHSFWETLSYDECIKHQRYLIFKTNMFANKNITDEEFQIRLREREEFTEWFWKRTIGGQYEKANK
jgi:hypothetical protein